MKELANRIIEHYERHAHGWGSDRSLRISAWNDKPWHAVLPHCPRDRMVLDLGPRIRFSIGLAKASEHFEVIPSIMPV